MSNEHDQFLINSICLNVVKVIIIMQLNYTSTQNYAKSGQGRSLSIFSVFGCQPAVFDHILK